MGVENSSRANINRVNVLALAESHLKVRDVLAFIGSDQQDTKDPDAEVTGFKPLSVAKRGDFTFVSGASEADLREALNSKATLIVAPLDARAFMSKSVSNMVYVGNPRLWFIRSLNKFIKTERPRGIHPSAVIESTKLGKGVCVGPGAFIGANVRIGDGAVIHGGVQLYEDTIVGNNVNIDSCTVVGSDGFGFERDETGELQKFPHVGNVIIEDNVEIGANVCIDRGTLGSTIIGSGTKIDNLVHIAHNVKIGKNCLVVAGSVLGGSSEFGDNVFVGISASIKEKVKVGRNSVVGMGAVVLKDVPEGITVVGVPARPLERR